LAAGTSCRPEVLQNACIKGTMPTFSCPWNNSDSGRLADYVGEVPHQVCQVCGVKADLEDEDVREGWFSGVVSFGAAEIGGIVDETPISEYTVYVVNASGARLGDPVAALPKRVAEVPGECCSGDTYQARIQVSLLGEREGFDRFVIFLVVNGIELPVGAPTAAIVDKKPGQCHAADCPTGYALKAEGLGCQNSTCDLPDDCCVPLGTCAELDCSSLGSDYIQKVEVPSNCSGSSCTQLECCELSEFAESFETPSTGQASSAAAVVVLLSLLCCGGGGFAAKHYCCSGKSRADYSLNQVVPVTLSDEVEADFDDLALPPLEEDVEAAVAAEAKRNREAEERRKEAEAAGFIKRTVGVFRRFAGAKQEEDCCGLLLGVMQTLLEGADDPKFRSLDLKNDTLASRVFSIQGTVELLEAAGFRQDPATSTLVLRANASMRTVELVKDALEERLAELFESRWEAEVPVIFPQAPVPDIHVKAPEGAAEEQGAISGAAVSTPPLSPDACAASATADSDAEAAEDAHSDLHGSAAGSGAEAADTTDGADLAHELP